MTDNCFCHFNGYEVKDAFAREAFYYTTPEMFGAVGDGVTDDYNAIMQALSAAYERDRVLMFFPKTYAISQSINITQGNIKIIGAEFSNRGVTNPTIRIMDATAPAFTLIGTPAEVEYGGTLENVTLENISIDRTDPAAGSVGVLVQYAQFVTLRNFAVSYSEKCVSFANVNGLFINHAYLSNDGEYENPRALEKFNLEGATGIRCFDVTYYSHDSRGIFCYDHTGSAQAGDRVYDAIEISGPVSHVLHYACNGGFSDHVFISKLSADNVKNAVILIANDTFNQYSSLNVSDCWVNLTDIAGSFLNASRYSSIVISNVNVNTIGGNYNILQTTGCKNVDITNVNIRGAARLDRAALFDSTTALTVSNLIVDAAGGAIWINDNCDKCLFTGVITPEPIQNSGTNFVKAACLPE